MAATAAGLDFSSALMKNQKAAQLIGDLSAFDAVQTRDGLGLLFSIGDDGVLYLCAEQVGAEVAWAPVDLTAGLGEGKVEAKSFAVAHDPAAGTIALAQVVRSLADGSERLCVLGGLSDASGAEWMTAVGKREWVARPYDGGGAGGEIAYVLLPRTRGLGAQTCVAGLRSGATGFVSNYAVDLDPTVTVGVWRAFETAENYDDLLGNAIGRPHGSPCPGLYELVALGEEVGLTFTPIATGAPPVRELAAPAGAGAIAVLPADEDGHTHLFVAGSGGLRLFPADGQGRDATGIELIADPLFAAADSLEVHGGDSYVTVWARNGQGQVVSSRAPVAEVEQPEAWSVPIPLLAGAEQIASVSSLATGGSEIYVHGGERTLTKLEQDPATTEWRRQALTLPALAVDDMVEVHTFTTHVNVRGEDSLPAPQAKVELRSASPCAVYVEGAHTRLSPAAPVEVEAGAGGTLTIVQQTETLAAVPYLITDAAGRVTEINPMGPALEQLGEVSAGSDLDRTVTDERGNSSPLVPPSVSGGDKQAVASAIAELHGTAQALPPGAPAGPSLLASALDGAAVDSSWTLSFAAGGVTFERGAPDFDAGDALESWWGDLVLWLEHALDDLTRVVVTIAEGVAHVFVEIAGEIYHAVLRCLADAMATFQLILRKLIAAFETLVKWLGMILNWQDILRSHAVLKNVIGCYLQHSVDELSSFKRVVDEALEQLDGRIEAWTGNGPGAQTPAATAAGNPLSSGQLHPAAHWGGHQQSQNIGSAVSTGSAADPEGGIEELLAALDAALEKEGEDLEKAWGQIESVFAEATTLTPGEIVARLLGILAELAVETVQVILDAVFEVLEIAAGGIVSALEAPIELPVLSPLYETFSGGSKLSFLDLGCLVAAIPATIVYKLSEGHAPFPDDEFTRALIAARDLEEIRRIFAESGAAATLARGTGYSQEKIWNIFVDYVAFASAVPAAVLASYKSIKDTMVISVSYAVTYVLYCAPCFTIYAKQTWDMIMGEAITGLSLAKNLADIPLYKYDKDAENSAYVERWNAASPWVEFVLDAVWMVPTFGPPCREPDAAVNWIVASGGALFNFAGMCALPLSKDLEPVSKTAWMLGMMGLMVGYGVLMGVAAEVEQRSTDPLVA